MFLIWCHPNSLVAVLLLSSGGTCRFLLTTKTTSKNEKKKKRGLSTSFRSLLVYIGSINLFDEILSMVMLEVHGNFGKFYLNLVNEILAVLN